MSLIVFAIAAIPAAVVLAVGAATRSRLWICIVALLAAAVGIRTGSPTYTLLDLLFVALATYFAWPPTDPAARQAKEEERAARRAYVESPEFKRKEAEWNTRLVLIAVGCVATYVYFQMRPAPKVTETEPVTSTSAQVLPSAQVVPAAPKVNLESPLIIKPAPPPQPPNQLPKRSRIQDANERESAWPSGRSPTPFPNCVYKGVMTDQDYRNCGLSPPQP